MFVQSDILHSHPLYKIDTAGKCCDVDKVGSAGLELEREIGKSGAVERHVTDHLSAPLIGRHALKEFPAAIQHSYSGRAVHLMR